MHHPLTDRQTRIYEAIRGSIRRERRPPTVDEICTATGIRSKSHVHYHLRALRDKGWIALEEHRARGIRLSHEPTVPVLGRIAAGFPIELFEEGAEELDLDEHLRDEVEQYALRVRGNSMIDEHIYDGDYVLVRPAPAAQNGEIIVAVHLTGQGARGAATVKRFFAEQERRRIRLQPANSTLEPTYVSATEWAREWAVQGIVTGVYRPM